MKKNRQKGFAKIDSLLSRTAKQYNLENAMYRHKALKYWTEVACAFVDEAKDLTRALDLNKGVLTVACLSREVAARLKLLAQRIIHALNQALGRQMVYAIYIET